jgi:hypothetical protein
MKPLFRMDARPLLIVAADVGAFLLAVLLLALLTLVRSLLSPLAFGVLAAALAAGFGLDLLLWMRRGIRSIEIDPDQLTLYRGPSMVPQRVPRVAVSSSRAVRGLGRRVALLRMVHGRPIRIPEDAFAHAEFSRFLTHLSGWRRE